MLELLELPDPPEALDPPEPPDCDDPPLPEPPLPEPPLPPDPPDPLPLDPPLPELPLPELLELPLEPDEDWELVLVEAGGGARYMTERTSISMRLSRARAKSARSTSSCPVDE